MGGSITRSNRSRERGSPWSVPLWTPMGEVWPWGVTNSVVAPLYRFEIVLMKSSRSRRRFNVFDQLVVDHGGERPFQV